MKELISEHSFVVALAVVAGLLFVIGIIVLLWARGKQRITASMTGTGLVIAGLALWLLWLVYGRIVQRFGLDSVKGLGVSIAVFVIAGAAIGALLGVWQRRKNG